MSQIDKELQLWLDENPGEVKLLENGKVKVSLTGHEMKAELALIKQHIAGKAYRRKQKSKEGRRLSSKEILERYDGNIVPHKRDSRKVYCTITSIVLNNDKDEIHRHVSGRKFQFELAQRPTKKIKEEPAAHAPAVKVEEADALDSDAEAEAEARNFFAAQAKVKVPSTANDKKEAVPEEDVWSRAEVFGLDELVEPDVAVEQAGPVDEADEDDLGFEVVRAGDQKAHRRFALVGDFGSDEGDEGEAEEESEEEEEEEEGEEEEEEEEPPQPSRIKKVDHSQQKKTKKKQHQEEKKPEAEARIVAPKKGEKSASVAHAKSGSKKKKAANSLQEQLRARQMKLEQSKVAATVVEKAEPKKAKLSKRKGVASGHQPKRKKLEQ